MVKKAYKNEIVNFEPNVPTTLVLDINPLEVRGKERTGNWGNYMNYSYFCTNDKMFFASSMLHDKLQGFSKGDTVTIQKVQDSQGGKIVWLVSSDNQKTNQFKASSESLLTKLMFEISSMNKKLDEVIKHIYGEEGNIKIPDFEEEEEEVEEVNDTELGF